MMSEEPWPRAGHSLSEQTGNPPAETPQLNIGFVVSDFVVSPEIMEIDPPQSVTENWQRLLDEFVGESVELQPERRATLAHINAVPQPIVTKPGGFIGAHHPSYQQNVISSNKFESEEAFFQTAQGFLLAHQVGALYYVVHPITMDDWTTDRSRQIELALS